MNATIFLYVYLASAVLALLATPVVIGFARIFNLVDTPGARHMHVRPMSHIGGIAIFAAMFLPLLAAQFASGKIRDIFLHTDSHSIAILGSVVFIFVVGLIDDLKKGGLRARYKLLAQLTAAFIICSAGIRIRTITLGDEFVLNLGSFSWHLTILWIVGVTNAVNLSDGLDGLAAGISVLCCVVIAVLALLSGSLAVAVITIALMGGLSGFLLFNFHPAKIFMGDCGSMFIGFTLASCTVLSYGNAQAFTGLALPALALGIPIIDTLASMLRRTIERRSIFSSDRRHFHHRLIDIGLSQPQAVITIYGLTILAVSLGLLMFVAPGSLSIPVFISILGLLVFVFIMVGSIRLAEIISGIKLKYKIRCREAAEVKEFEEAQLHFRQAATFDQWWRAASNAAEKMEFVSLDLRIRRRDGIVQTLRWKPDSQEFQAYKDEFLTARIPVRDRRDGPALKIKVKVCRNGSLESAARRITLFTRLVEEYHIGSLPGNGKRNKPSPGQTSETTNLTI